MKRSSRFSIKDRIAKMSVVAAGPIFNFILAFVFVVCDLILGRWIDLPVLAGTPRACPRDGRDFRKEM